MGRDVPRDITVPTHTFNGPFRKRRQLYWVYDVAEDGPGQCICEVGYVFETATACQGDNFRTQHLLSEVGAARIFEVKHALCPFQFFLIWVSAHFQRLLKMT